MSTSRSRPSSNARSTSRNARSGGKQGSRNAASSSNNGGSSQVEKRKIVGQYMLGKTIGEGTFGKVKLAIHIPTGEKVAIKILEKNRIKDQADVRRVNREIKILKKNRHHNIIQLFEVLDTQNTIYLIMECCDGGEMFDFIVAQKHVAEVQACKFFHQILDGVEILHKNDVTHRDLKPENLLLKASTDGWIVKIVDFGLSNTHEGGRLLATACGSPCYAAPEMIAGRKYQGPKADMWSIGVILFALVSGFLPFEDPNTSVLYKKILSGDYTPPKWLSGSVKDLIRKILETDPRKRYTIADVRKHPWYNLVGEHEIPRDEAVIFASTSPQDKEAEAAKAEVLKAITAAGMDSRAVMDGVASHACNSLTAMYFLLQQKHRAIRMAQRREEGGGGGAGAESSSKQITATASNISNASERSHPETLSDGTSAVAAVKPSPLFPQQVGATAAVSAAAAVQGQGQGRQPGQSQAQKGAPTPYLQAPPILQQHQHSRQQQLQSVHANYTNNAQQQQQHQQQHQQQQRQQHQYQQQGNVVQQHAAGASGVASGMPSLDAYMRSGMSAQIPSSDASAVAATNIVSENVPTAAVVARAGLHATSVLPAEVPKLNLLTAPSSGAGGGGGGGGGGQVYVSQTARGAGSSGVASQYQQQQPQQPQSARAVLASNHPPFGSSVNNANYRNLTPQQQQQLEAGQLPVSIPDELRKLSLQDGGAVDGAGGGGDGGGGAGVGGGEGTVAGTGAEVTSGFGEGFERPNTRRSHTRSSGGSRAGSSRADAVERAAKAAASSGGSGGAGGGGTSEAAIAGAVAGFVGNRGTYHDSAEASGVIPAVPTNIQKLQELSLHPQQKQQQQQQMEPSGAGVGGGGRSPVGSVKTGSPLRDRALHDSSSGSGKATGNGRLAPSAPVVGSASAASGSAGRRGRNIQPQPSGSAGAAGVVAADALAPVNVPKTMPMSVQPSQPTQPTQPSQPSAPRSGTTPRMMAMKNKIAAQGGNIGRLG